MSTASEKSGKRSLKHCQMMVYNALVNRHPGIAARYHRVHDHAKGPGVLLSWLYLVWLNICYYVFFCRFLDEPPACAKYRYHRLPVKESESQHFLRRNPGLTKAQIIKELENHDVVSFDLFDTLVFRPFDKPSDLFYFIGERLGIMDFKRRRVEAERRARMIRFEKSGDREVTLEEIWEVLAGMTGIPADTGIKTEIETELSLCYANPLMQEVWDDLKRSGTIMIIASDMYLSSDTIRTLLDKNGFEGYDKIFVSCEYRKNKHQGDLYEIVKAEYPGKSIVHIGDNVVSDMHSAKRHGIHSIRIPNVNDEGHRFRSQDMSPIVGSAYRGIVNAHLYSGVKPYDRYYEYGFIYGGLFVTGYCRFIHDRMAATGSDLVIFLSRDGDILKKVYDEMYPEEHTVYAYWSRKAASKLMYGYEREAYYERFLYQKVNQGYTIKSIIDTMDLSHLIDIFDENGLSSDTELTDKNVTRIRSLLENKSDEIMSVYKKESGAAGRYYASLTSGADKAIVVDVGWAGSGAYVLSVLFRKEWDIKCLVHSLVAGTNTVNCVNSDVSESFLQNGTMESYMFSQSHNRQIMSGHDPNRNDNIYFELLLSSDSPQLDGFLPGRDTVRPDQTYIPEADITLRFGPVPEHTDRILEIRQGVMDFAGEYRSRFSEYPYMMNIGGHDAYAPMFAAKEYNRRYLKAIYEGFYINAAVE